MEILENLFLLFTIFSTIHAHYQNVCPTSLCGDLTLLYPFKLNDTRPNDNCPHIDITCSATNGTATITIPYAGDFGVRNIYYYDPVIQLYDPGNCLMGRLMKNLNLSSSLFTPVDYEDYTFYVCPSNASIIGYYAFFPIDCLSNSTYSTIATSLLPSDVMSDYGCQVIGSWPLPVLGIGQFEFNGINSDLYLAWNSTSCNGCGDYSNQLAGTGESKRSLWSKFAESPLFIPAFMTMAVLLVICILSAAKVIAGRNQTNHDFPTADGLPVSAAAPQTSTVGGLDESKINACTELVILSESRINPGLDSNTCSICLESYLPQQVLRSITTCEHLFHADCIGLWLRKNRTCPVCRTLLSDIDL